MIVTVSLASMCCAAIAVSLECEVAALVFVAAAIASVRLLA